MTDFDFSACTSYEEINALYKAFYGETFGDQDHFGKHEQYWPLAEAARKAYERFPAQRSAIDVLAEETKRKNPKTIPAHCLGCGVAFQATSIKQLYHSRECWTQRGSKSDPKPESDSKKIREWARTNGFEVGQRGRIHPDILKAYAAAV